MTSRNSTSTDAAQLTRREILTDALVGAGATGLLSATTARADATTPSGAPLPTGDIHDFDFLVGKWTFVNRRLKRRWAGSKDWDEFPGVLVCENRMRGIVIIDENVFPTQGWSGMALRTFNLSRRQWSIYWINSANGELQPPVVGGFKGDHGEFYGDDVDEGKPIKVVFHWTRLGPNAARWEQAFSLDGRNWETNWIMEHTRIA